MAKKEEVWVCAASSDPRFSYHLIAENQLTDEERWRDAIFKNDRGEPLAADRFPKSSQVDPEMYKYLADFEGKKLTYKKGLPYLFTCGYIYVSSDLADILRVHDLGNGALYPTRFFEVDGTTEIPGEYFCLNFGNTKAAFMPDQSPKARPFNEASKVITKWVLPWGQKNGDIAVSTAALRGADIWIDPVFWNAFFISGRLQKAQKAAKFTSRFAMRKCCVIDQV